MEVLESPSLFLQGMAGSRLPIAVAHGEGYANFKYRGNADKAIAAMRYVDNHGRATEQYPFNPNGSAGGLTAVTTADGRFTAMMPHPERVFRNVQMSWTSEDQSQYSGWMRIWRNARKWVGYSTDPPERLRRFPLLSNRWCDSGRGSQPPLRGGPCAAALALWPRAFGGWSQALRAVKLEVARMCLFTAG